MCNRKKFEAPRNIGRRVSEILYTQKPIFLTRVFYGIIEPIVSFQKKDDNSNIRLYVPWRA
jgi:hypothetical protein